MRSLPRVPKKRRRRCWFRASTTTKYVTVRSECGWFLGHWSGGAVRCDSTAECSICASGAGQRLFTYIFIEDEFGEILTFEIPERLIDLAEELGDSVGSQLAIRREGTARNSRIDIIIVGSEVVDKLDIWPFVDTLGRSREVPKTTPTQSESFALREAGPQVP